MNDNTLSRNVLERDKVSQEESWMIVKKEENKESKDCEKELEFNADENKSDIGKETNDNKHGVIENDNEDDDDQLLVRSGDWKARRERLRREREMKRVAFRLTFSSHVLL